MTGNDQHVMPGWQEHTPSPTCWCQPAPQDEVIGLDGSRQRTWLHRAAHDDPHRYPEDADPALTWPGRQWVLHGVGRNDE